MTKKALFSLILCSILSGIGCTATQNVRLEKALFEMDAGNYTAAISDINQAYAVEPTNEEVVLIRASAYAGRAGVNLITLAQKLTDAANADNAFQVVHDAMVDSIGATGLDDLQKAITTLTAYDTTVGLAAVVEKAEVYGNLGLLQAIEAFSRPTIRAKPTTDAITDTSLITSENKDDEIVQTDLIAADNFLVTNAGYPEDNQLVKVIRQNYCTLSNATPAVAGFTLEELRDITACQLADDPDSLSLAGGTLTSAATCATFNFTPCESAVDSTLN